MTGSIAAVLPLKLAKDTKIVPVKDLSAAMAAKIGAGDGDFAIFRPGGRSPAKLISADFAKFLAHFARPTGIKEAVLRFAQESDADPEALLEEAFPILEKLMRAAFLVFDDAAAPEKIAEPALRTDFKTYRIVRPIQMLDDVEVYCAKAANGQLVALKLAVTPDASTRHGILREVDALTRLQGLGVPAVIDHGVVDNQAYIATEWIAGVPVDRAADAIRHQSSASQDAQLLALCVNLAEIYWGFHQQGVLHGDVHPRNVLVSGDGSITVIDFGLSRNGQSSRRLHRGGVGFFFEPEYAAARIAKQRPPAVTEQGEQYSLAVLLYRIVTGHWYLPFSFNKDDAYKQILEARTSDFSAVGCKAWPALEQILQKALSKSPADRYPALGDLIGQLRAVNPRTDTRYFAEIRPEIARFVSASVAELMRLGADAEAERAPRASMNIGLGGTAYGVYRLALNNRSPELLVLADLLAEKAEASRKDDDAFWSPETGVTEDVVTAHSVMHAGPGITATRAFIAHARGDVFNLSNAITKFIEEMRGAEKLDFSFGRAGALVIGANLLRVAARHQLTQAAELRAFGNQIEQSFLQELTDQWHATPKLTGYLGIAHGWAGYLHGILKWREATESPLPAILPEWLLALAALAEPHGRGARWPRKQPAPKPDYVASWCNGTAGFVHLWLQAHRQTGNPAFLKLAEQAAWYSWDSEELGGDLCCGGSGRAYALLACADATGDPAWRERAAALTRQAVKSIQQNSISNLGLYKGPIGVLVLGSDLLTSLETASMPFFGNEP